MVSLILPTYNNSETLPTVVRQIFEVTAHHRIKAEVIVIDDNSPDGTGELAYYLKKFFPRLKSLHRTRRLGKTSAILEGLQHAEHNVVGTLHADLSHPPTLLPHLLLPLVSGTIDLTIGSRHLPESQLEHTSLGQRLAWKAGGMLLRPLTGVRDPLSGYWCIRRPHLRGLSLPPHTPYLLPEVLIRANYQTAQEVPYRFDGSGLTGSRRPGSRKIFATLRQIGILYQYSFGSPR